MCPDLPPNHTRPRSAPQHQRAGMQDSWGQGRGGRPWERKRAAVFQRDKYLCQYCLAGGRKTPVELHGKNAGICDHVIPKSEGGTDNESNLKTACKACSDKKTARESLRARADQP